MRSCGDLGLAGASCSDSIVYALSPGRFTLLTLYALASLMAALVWNIMAPIYSIAEERFDRGAQAINSLANAYYVWYCPGSVLALWVTERYGLRVSLLWGFFSQFIMASMSYGGLFISDPHDSFFVVWFAQVIGSFGQPLILNNVVRLAADWFPKQERDMAVTVTVVARSIGVMGISAITPFIVTEPSEIPRLYWWQVPIWAVLNILGFLCITDKPLEGPPSAAAAHQWEQDDMERLEHKKLGKSEDKAALEAIWDDTKELWQNSNFIYLSMSFSLLTGLGWTFLTIVGQILEPCGYSNEVAGLADAVFMGFNALGCFAVVPIVEATRGYLELQQSFSWLTAITSLGVFITARPGPAWQVLLAWSLSGFFMGPLTPLSFEHAAEMTFPVAANSSTTVLNILGNFVGFLETVLVTPLLELTRSTECSTVVTWGAGFMMGCCAIGMVFTMLMWKDYRRQAAEKLEGGARVSSVEVSGGKPDTTMQAPSQTTPLLRETDKEDKYKTF